MLLILIINQRCPDIRHGWELSKSQTISIILMTRAREWIFQNLKLTFVLKFNLILLFHTKHCNAMSSLEQAHYDTWIEYPLFIVPGISFAGLIAFSGELRDG